jgi:hypothetical protein
MANWSRTQSQGWGDLSEGWEATINGTKFTIVVDAKRGGGTLYRHQPGKSPINVKDGPVEQLKRYAETIKFSRPGAKATFKVEDRFYFGKGRKERFWARGYDDAKDRVRRSPELGKYAKIIMQPEFDTADHWEWVSRASTSEIVNWAKSISRDM